MITAKTSTAEKMIRAKTHLHPARKLRETRITDKGIVLIFANASEEYSAFLVSQDGQKIIQTCWSSGYIDMDRWIRTRATTQEKTA